MTSVIGYPVSVVGEGEKTVMVLVESIKNVFLIVGESDKILIVFCSDM